jgi:nitrate reductase gamma subunit
LVPNTTTRETGPPWFRSLFIVQFAIEAEAAAAPSFKVHALIGRLLFASWPFTRVVHACTAPLGDLFRP